MKYAVALFVCILFLAFGAGAQDSQVLPSTSVAAPDATVVPDTPRMLASVTLIPAVNLTEPEGFPSPAANSPLPQRGVQGIDPTYGFQAYFGYTFVHFNAFPAREVSRNGLDISMAYSIKQGLFGVEGALTAAFGSIANERSDFAFVGGGPRVCWSGPQGLEFWAHGLAGDAHFGPRAASFGQDGFAYELGGGVDIAAHFRRLAYRVEADMIGSRLYHTNQFSPKVSAGIVYKF